MKKLKNLGWIATEIALLSPGIGSLAQTAYAVECDPTAGGIGSGAKCAQPSDTPGNLFGQTGLFKTITNTLIFLVGAIAVIMLIIGGLRYVTSGGNAESVNSAKNTILYAVIGIVVAILAFAVVNFVISRVGGEEALLLQLLT